MSMDLPPVPCASCGTANQAGRKFCAQCGANLGVACPSCGTRNPASDRFCGECGSSLGTGAAAAAPGAADSGAERRLVSVMFADLVGFTTLAEGRDAEETRELLTGYFDLARGVIEIGAGEGTLLKKLACRYPGTPLAGCDLAPRPADLPAAIEWHQQDVFECLADQSAGVLAAKP